MAGFDRVTPALQALVTRALQISSVPFGMYPSGGWRTPQEQRALARAGWSKISNGGTHVEGRAIDLIPIINGQPAPDDSAAYAQVRAAMAQASKELGVPLTYGADWKSFPDKPHYEVSPEVARAFKPDTNVAYQAPPSLDFSPEMKSQLSQAGYAHFNDAGGSLKNPYGGPPGPWYDPKNHAAFQDLANQAADKYGIPRDVFNAMVYHESNWDPSLVSSAGAVGIAQVKPSTAGLTAAQLKDPATGLDAGAKYLAEQYQHFGTWPIALAAYNGGPGGTRAGAGYARDVMTLVGQGNGAYAGASAPVQQAALGTPAAYPTTTASLLFGGGGSNVLAGGDQAPVMPTAQVGGGQPLSPYVRGDFFPTPAPTLQPHATAPMSYAPAALSAIQPYSTQPPPLPPAAGGPAMGGYAPPAAAALPVAPSDYANPFDVTQQNLPGQMPAAPPPVADVAGSGGTGSLLGNIVQGVKHLVQTAVPGGLHMPQSFANAGMMSGITGFGGGPLPGGVTDRASGASWLGQQAWHPASLFNSSGGINPSGGSSYNYFSPSSPGGIGGYVSHSGQLFTYPTDPDIYHSVAS